MFSNIVVILPFTIVFINIWFFFLKNNFYYTRLNPTSNTILKNSNVLKKLNFKVLLNFNLISLLYLLIVGFFQNGVTSSFWFNHLIINNYNSNLIILINILIILIQFFIKNMNKDNNVNSNDYYFSLVNIGVFSMLLFLNNTFYTLIFLLEVISVFIFYKFTVTKFWFSNKFNFVKNFSLLEKKFCKDYLNILFFQYWVNFFSTILLLFSIINLLHMYGTTDWILLNLLNQVKLNIFDINSTFNLLFWIPAFIGFFLKIGITPLHLFKIEIYKGIPFLSIYFYTTFYFCSYFLLFSNMLFLYLNSFRVWWWFFIIIFFLLGIFYMVNLLFDTTFVKAFFAYSTIANSLGFLCLLVSIL
jgi:NADH:ubiquinone oxidoreductase subunit 2 (subunit N)